MQITKVTIAGMALVCGLSSASYGVQLLTNRDFENANHSLNWTVNAPIQVKEYPGSFNSAGLAPEANGPWGLDLVHNASDTINQANAQQHVNVAPGLYDISASVWVRVYDNSTTGGLSRARFSVRVDGAAFSPNIDLLGPSNGSGWTPWTKLTYSAQNVAVTTSIGVFLQMRADGSGGATNWGQVSADSFRLDAVMIPEPAGLLLLGLGSVVLLPRRMRRN